MKKHILLFIVVTICITSCFRYNETDFLCDCGKIEINKKEYIAMCVVPEEVTNSSVNYLRIENHTNLEMTYGDDCYFEYFDENNWQPITMTGGTEMLFGTFAGESTIKQLNLYSLVKESNDAKKGKYRILKDVSLSTGKYNRYDLVAEFEVK
jgi:hypothetical protein